jgi:hypothetical protein
MSLIMIMKYGTNWLTASMDGFLSVHHFLCLYFSFPRSIILGLGFLNRTD